MALAQERERELSQRDDLIRVLTQTRDQALATLQRHGLAIPTQIPNKGELETLRTHDANSLQDLPPEERVNALEAQNDNLRGVIRQTRHDMEDLSNQLATRPPSAVVQSRDGEEGASVPLTKGVKPCLVAMISYVFFF